MHNLRNRNKVVASINQVDMSNMKMPMIAVYEHPDDFPEKCVARVFDLDKPTNVILIRDTVEELQEEIRKNTSKVFLLRGAEDVRTLVGVWV